MSSSEDSSSSSSDSDYSPRDGGSSGKRQKRTQSDTPVQKKKSKNSYRKEDTSDSDEGIDFSDYSCFAVNRANKSKIEINPELAVAIASSVVPESDTGCEVLTFISEGVLENQRLTKPSMKAAVKHINRSGASYGFATAEGVMCIKKPKATFTPVAFFEKGPFIICNRVSDQHIFVQRNDLRRYNKVNRSDPNVTGVCLRLDVKYMEVMRGKTIIDKDHCRVTNLQSEELEKNITHATVNNATHLVCFTVLYTVEGPTHDAEDSRQVYFVLGDDKGYYEESVGFVKLPDKSTSVTQYNLALHHYAEVVINQNSLTRILRYHDSMAISTLNQPNVNAIRGLIKGLKEPKSFGTVHAFVFMTVLSTVSRPPENFVSKMASICGSALQLNDLYRIDLGIVSGEKHTNYELIFYPSGIKTPEWTMSTLKNGLKKFSRLTSDIDKCLRIPRTPVLIGSNFNVDNGDYVENLITGHYKSKHFEQDGVLAMQGIADLESRGVMVPPAFKVLAKSQQVVNELKRQADLEYYFLYCSECRGFPLSFADGQVLHPFIVEDLIRDNRFGNECIDINEYTWIENLCMDELPDIYSFVFHLGVMAICSQEKTSMSAIIDMIHQTVWKKFSTEYRSSECSHESTGYQMIKWYITWLVSVVLFTIDNLLLISCNEKSMKPYSIECIRVSDYSGRKIEWYDIAHHVLTNNTEYPEWFRVLPCFTRPCINFTPCHVIHIFASCWASKPLSDDDLAGPDVKQVLSGLSFSDYMQYAINVVSFLKDKHGPQGLPIEYLPEDEFKFEMPSEYLLLKVDSIPPFAYRDVNVSSHTLAEKFTLLDEGVNLRLDVSSTRLQGSSPDENDQGPSRIQLLEESAGGGIIPIEKQCSKHSMVFPSGGDPLGLPDGDVEGGQV